MIIACLDNESTLAGVGAKYAVRVGLAWLNMARHSRVNRGQRGWLRSFGPAESRTEQRFRNDGMRTEYKDFTY